MDELKQEAKKLIFEFKGNSYIYGLGCIDKIGDLAKNLGKKAVLVISDKSWAKNFKDKIMQSLFKAGVEILKTVGTARPNTPSEDVFLLQDLLVKEKPDFLIAAGGGSAIDCAKAAAALAVISPFTHDVEPLFGVGKVSEILNSKNLKMLPVLAVQMSASSAAHLTKYSNITYLETYQKKLIVDDEIVPPYALFDYEVTATADRDLTIDGVLDGISHCLEVYYGANFNSEDPASIEKFKKIEQVAINGISLLINSAKKCLDEPSNLFYREAIGLGTDLGGYSIMLGGTNGGHLTSFTLIKILSHGRACGILNPYWTVFFAPAIKRQLSVLIGVFKDYIDIDKDYIDIEDAYTDIVGDYIDIDNEGLKDLKGFKSLKSYEKPSSSSTLKENSSDNFSSDSFSAALKMAKIVANGMINFLKSLGVPTRLQDVEGFSDDLIFKTLESAKNPQLEMKLKNMPVSLSASMVDEYMLPILNAAKTGDLTLIKTL